MYAMNWYVYVYLLTYDIFTVGYRFIVPKRKIKFILKILVSSTSD